MRAFVVWGTVVVILGCHEPAPRSAAPAHETWELAETVRIGSTTGADYPLQRVLGLLPAPDGSVLVRQARSQEVPVFSAEGHLIRVIGRSGEGPGEYLSVHSMGWLADTLWIADWRLRRVSYHSAVGDFLSDASYEVDAPGVGLTSTSPFHISGEWAAMHPGVRVQMMDRIALPVLRTDRTGLIRDTLSLWDRSKLMTRVVREGRENPIFRPFLGMERSASSPSGSFMGLLEPVADASGDTVKATLKVWNRAGDQVLNRDLSRVSALVPEVRTSEWLEEQSTRGTQGPQDAAQYRRELENTVEIPPRFGFGDALVVSDEGQVWVGLIAEGGGRTWWILDAHGRMLAETVTPVGTELAAIGPDAVWGVVTDELGIDYIVRFEVIDHG